MRKECSLALILVLGWATSCWGQTHQTSAPLSGVPQTAFTYFEQVEDRRFNEFLHRLRPSKLSPELKERVLKMLPKADLVSPSGGQQAKLRALGPILQYHERDSAVELKVLRVPTATTAFLAGAAVLITEPALEVLSAEELQAVVAHELGHEYFWGEFELARQHEQYSKLQELELRCDGIAVITLSQLGLNPESLISGVTKLNRYNGHKEGATAAGRYLLLEERVKFIRSMIEMARAGSKVAPTLACK